MNKLAIKFHPITQIANQIQKIHVGWMFLVSSLWMFLVSSFMKKNQRKLLPDPKPEALTFFRSLSVWDQAFMNQASFLSISEIGKGEFDSTIAQNGTMMDSVHTGMGYELKSIAGKPFDSIYTSGQVNSHQIAVSELVKEQG